MERVCDNCMWCVLDTCEYINPNTGEKRNLYVGMHNTTSGCNACKTTEEYDKENENG